MESSAARGGLFPWGNRTDIPQRRNTEGTAFLVVDVSHLRCKELKDRCNEMVNKSWDFQRGVELLLSEWRDHIHYMEEKSSPLRQQVKEDMHYPGPENIKKIRAEVLQWADTVIVMSQAKHTMSESTTAAAKIRQWNVRAPARECFNEHLIPRAEKHLATFSRKIKISMELILSEMMISLGWNAPQFSNTWRSMRKGDVCKSEVHLTGINTSPDYGRISLVGADELSEVQAMESASKAAVFYLEKSMSICLIDINYNKRLFVKEAISQGKSGVDFSSSLGRCTMAEWEVGMENLGTCDHCCQQMLAVHAEKDPCDGEYNVKLECAETISQLYKEWLTDLRLARRRYKSFCTPLEKE